MSETGGVKPESQTVRGCSALRELCQKEIFKKMDSQHETQMKAITGVGKKIAFMEGVASTSRPRTNGIKKDENGKRDWAGIIIQFIIAWGPWILMVFGLGLIAWLKSKGIL